MDKLTKENFFNEMQQKFPKAMESFCRWIDNYKFATNWTKLFNAGYSDRKSGSTQAPKYHDLPIAMQLGIFSQWVHYYGICESPKPDEQSVFSDHVMLIITNTLEQTEEELNEQTGNSAGDGASPGAEVQG